MATNMSAGWAAFFDSFRGDLDRDMEYSRMQAHQNFLTKLKRQDMSSGYVLDGKPLTNFEYENLSDAEKQKTQSQANFQYNQKLELLGKQDEMARERLVTEDEMARERMETQADIDIKTSKANVQNRLALEKGALEQERLQNQKKYESFKGTDTYRNLPPEAKSVVNLAEDMGAPMEKLSGTVLKSLTDKKEAKDVSDAALRLSSDNLQKNPEFMAVMTQNPTLGMSMIYENARIVQGLPDEAAQNDLRILALAMSEFIRTPVDEREDYLDNLEKTNPRVYDGLTSMLDEGLQAVKEVENSKKPEKGSKAWNSDISQTVPVFRDISGRGGSAGQQAVQNRTQRPSVGRRGQILEAPALGEMFPGGSLLEDNTQEDMSRFQEAGSLLR